MKLFINLCIRLIMKDIKIFCSPLNILQNEYAKSEFKLKREQNMAYFFLAMLIAVVSSFQYIIGITNIFELFTSLFLGSLIFLLIKMDPSLLNYFVLFLGIGFGNYQIFFIKNTSFIPSAIAGLAAGPPIILGLTRSISISGTLFIANVLHSSFILRPKFIQFLALSDNHHAITSFSNSISYHFKYGFFIMVILWFFLEKRRKTFEKKCKQKKALEVLNKDLIKVNLELAHAVEIKQNLLLNISHEVRNPLNVISSCTQMALIDNPTFQTKNHLKNIKISVELVLFLLNNLLDSHKMETTDLEISKSIFNSLEFFDKVWNTSKILISKKGLYGEMLIAKNIPENIRLDKLRMMQIIYNLVGNASKFTNTGYIGIICTWIEKDNFEEYMTYPTEEDIIRHYLFEKSKQKKINKPRFDSIISITTSKNDSNLIFKLNHNTDSIPNEKSNTNVLNHLSYYKTTQAKTLNYQEVLGRYRKLGFEDIGAQDISYASKSDQTKISSGYLKLEVIDSGSGITEDDLKNLFQKFGQVGESSKKKLGTGLGLWIVKSLCHGMNGDLRVYSKFQNGSIFVSLIKC